MESRLFDFEKDYEMVSDWWTKRNHVVITKDFLSDYAVIGIVNNKPLAVMWFYPILSSKWCMLRFPITNPDSTKEERDMALNIVFDNLHGIAKDMGYKHIFCTTSHPALIARLNKYGYTQESENCIHFWGGL